MNGNGNSLQADLKRVTESGVLEVPEALLAPVLEFAHGQDDRKEIMRHLQGCLSEPSIAKWRRVYAGLVLTEALVQKGPPELLAETSMGLHFDLTQRLAFLEGWSNEEERKVQNTIRTKAKALRAELVTRMQEANEINESLKDTASTGSPGTRSVLTSISTNTGPSGFGSDAPMPMNVERPQGGQLVLNGIVAVGHHDDTTSDESEGEGCRKAVSYRGNRRSSQAKRNSASSAAKETTLAASGQQQAAAAVLQPTPEASPAPAAPAPTAPAAAPATAPAAPAPVDLLDSAPPPEPSPAPAATSTDLLDM